ncbi:hypothetical protein [Bacillus sp. B-jedd]|uniref:hypothetical protein n=1 Tax=Bacillus sp. B-jedd TaxID=1476857 RepID=UPI00051557EB|nr:hypothetical protein [Bacillus sp. B-jedd]CEG26353.1 hypothetical protein BN1002_01198 [Bacillus sp. B-jedd]
MDDKFSRPKSVGEILDHTFTLSKNHFKKFMTVLLAIMGPVYLIDALFQVGAGKPLFRDNSGEGDWFEQMMASLEGREVDPSLMTGELVGIGVTALLSLFLFPIAQAAILFAVNHVRKNEEYTVGSVFKLALSRYWAMIGSSILFFLMAIAFITIPTIGIVTGGMIGALYNNATGIILTVIGSLGLFLVAALLLTRFSFYFGSVVLDRKSPGLGRSWKLTKKRTWKLLGIYIVFSLITTIIATSVEMAFTAFLGGSVLLSIIVSLVSILTTMFFSVGYCVIYLDLKVRNEAEDLKELLSEYGPLSS